METRIASATRALRHVFVRDLVLPARIGVHPHELAGPQPIRINLDLGVEDDGARARSRAPVGRDELARVVDYETLTAQVRALVASGHVRLVETLAERTTPPPSSATPGTPPPAPAGTPIWSPTCAPPSC